MRWGLEGGVRFGLFEDLGRAGVGRLSWGFGLEGGRYVCFWRGQVSTSESLLV